jgi:uncharacterized membrane protein YphA (DoxX/SURF4 family)
MKNQIVAAIFLRLSLAITYVSAYSSRINLFGNHPDGWKKFIKYASEVNSYAPDNCQNFLAISATTLEITLSILLLLGIKIKQTAIASGILTLLFAMAMTWSFGIKEPLDYGVFVNFSAAFLLSTIVTNNKPLTN